MAREIGISSPHRQVAKSRWRNTQWFELRSIWEGLLPVARLGHVDFSDTERPQWGITCQADGANFRYASASITSAADIAIEQVSFNVFTAAGIPFDSPVTGFTPDAGYVPFAENAIAWWAGIRPRIQFDTGRTVVVTGRNAAVYGNPGLFAFSSRSPHAASIQQVLYFDPPLILPATMFFTLQEQISAQALIASFRYREIG